MGDMGSEDWTKMAAGALGGTNILIDDSPGITVHDIRSKCRRLKKQEGLGLIVIDYLQLISGTSRGRGTENRRGGVRNLPDFETVGEGTGSYNHRTFPAQQG